MDAQGQTRFVVLKFGGTSVSTKTRWQTIARLMQQAASEHRAVLTVVSALSGITNQLQGLIDLRGDNTACDARVEAIVQRHRDFVAELELTDACIAPWLQRLADLLQDPRRATGEFTWQAEILAMGELLSSSIGAAYLNALGVTTVWLDARAYLRAQESMNQSEWARTLSVNCEAKPDPVVQAKLSSQATFFITQGFIARNEAGQTVILGRGGSDTSAAYFGSLLQAERVEIWTDVAGMFSANPREVSDARLLSKLDYAEAQEIATTGAKVLHPRSLGPVREANVPMWIKDTNRPELPGTVITAQTISAPGVKAISTRKGITLVSMETIGMWQQVGFLADVFAIFKKHGLSVDLIGSAETNVTVSLDPSENLVNSDVLSSLCEDLARVCRVKVITPCMAITMVGRGMRRLMHQLAPVMAEFGQLNVHLISQSSNDLNLTFVVDEVAGESLVPRLHTILTEADAMPVEDQSVFGPRWQELYQTPVDAVTQAPWWQRSLAPLRALARERSPRYVYAREAVQDACARVRELAAVDRRFYAMKANSHPALLRTVDAAGFDFECVSMAEVEHLRAALPDLASNRILFTPNFAPRAEYEAALQIGAILTIDALHPLLHWGESLRGREVLLRLDLGRGLGHHHKVKTGGDESKFGIPLRDLERAMELSRALDVRVVGLHAHLGSGIVEPSHWQQVYAELLDVAQRIPSVRSLNIGGGLGVPARAEQRALDLKQLNETLLRIKQTAPEYELWIEPGRYLVADAGVLLARVTQIKHKEGRAYLGVDAGMNSLIRPALYGAHHEMFNLDRIEQVADTLYDVVGPICESGDVLGEKRRMPRAEEGDVILIAQAGAYGATMASNYNQRAPAEEVVW